MSAYEIFAVDDYISVKFAARLQFAAYTTLELLIFSYAAENIRMESENVAEKIYKSHWYDRKSNKRDVRQLMLTSMQRARQPVKISAMGFSDVSYETFVNASLLFKIMQLCSWIYFHFKIVKFSYSALMLMIQTQQRKNDASRAE